MRPRLLAPAAVLLIALAACGDTTTTTTTASEPRASATTAEPEATTATADPSVVAEPPNPCDVLSIEEVSTLVGGEVSLRPHDTADGTRHCEFEPVDGETPTLSVWSAAGGDLDAAAAEISGGTVEDLEIEGASRAVIVTDDSAGYDVVTVLAQSDAAVHAAVVDFYDSATARDVAVGAMAALLD